MKEIKVSACIITYNQEKYIRECIEGAINQMVNFDYEIVIGDDCSTDNTLQICKEYASRFPEKIKILERDENKGMIWNWTDAIHNCSGKYIALCEGDDYWTDNEKLQRQVNLLEQNPALSCCFHKAFRYDEANENRNKIYPENLNKTIFDAKSFFSIPTIPTASFIFINKIKFPTLVHSHADTMLYATLLSMGSAGFIDESMSLYRLHNEGVSSSYNENWYLERRIKELDTERKYPDFSLKVKGEITRIYINHVISYLNKNRNTLTFSQKIKYLKTICFSKYFYKKSVKEYLILLKTVLK